MTAGERVDRAVTWAADGRATLHVADCSLARAAAAAGQPVVTLLGCAHEPAGGRARDAVRAVPGV